MISPMEVAAQAKQKENENYAFRIYLKSHADPKKLDAQFHKMHKELFSHYDCNSCRNCCKEFSGNLSDEDITKCARKFKTTPDDFKSQYLRQNQEGSYDTRHIPCDFLQKDGSCLLGECKPLNCAEFPFTARPDRWGSLLGIVNNASVCPVLFEMLERLKDEYGFVYHKKPKR